MERNKIVLFEAMWPKVIRALEIREIRVRACRSGQM